MDTTQLIAFTGLILGCFYKLFKEFSNSAKNQNEINLEVLKNLARLNEEQKWQNEERKEHNKRIKKLEER